MFCSLNESSFEERSANLQLPDTVTKLTTPYRSTVYIVGTAHFSENSQEDGRKKMFHSQVTDVYVMQVAANMTYEQGQDIRKNNPRVKRTRRSATSLQMYKKLPREKGEKHVSVSLSRYDITRYTKCKYLYIPQTPQWHFMAICSSSLLHNTI